MPFPWPRGRAVVSLPEEPDGLGKLVRRRDESWNGKVRVRGCESQTQLEVCGVFLV
jgi:hypothetical protein